MTASSMLNDIAKIIRGVVAVLWLLWVTFALVGFLPLMGFAWLCVAGLWVLFGVPIMFIFCALANEMDNFRAFLEECAAAWLAKIVEVVTAIPTVYRGTYYWVLGRSEPS